MKDSIREWLESREFVPNECHPFTDIESLTNEIKTHFESNEIEFVGIRPFGETLIIDGWEDGRSISYHINPTLTKENYKVNKRVRMNPNVDTNTNKN
jgi:hypothetical protein